MEMFVDSYAYVESVENGVILLKVESEPYTDGSNLRNTFFAKMYCSTPEAFCMEKGQAFIVRHRGRQLIELIKKIGDWRLVIKKREI